VAGRRVGWIMRVCAVRETERLVAELMGSATARRLAGVSADARAGDKHKEEICW